MLIQAVVQQVVEQSPLDQLMSAIIKAVAAGLALGATWLSVQTALYVKAKFGLDISATKMNDAFKTGIRGAEEWANKTLLPNPNEPTQLIKPTGEMKLQKAREIATSVYPKAASVPQDQFQYRIDSLLTELRGKMSLPPMKMDSTNPAPNADLAGHLAGSSKFPPAAVPREFLDADTSPGKKRVPSPNEP